MINLETFHWESEEQRKGVLSLKQYLHDRLGDATYLEDAVLLSFFYFIQKDHEGVQWMIQTFGNQIKSLQDEIVKLRKELDETNRRIL